MKCILNKKFNYIYLHSNRSGVLKSALNYDARTM